jgi:hypothetical protein
MKKGLKKGHALRQAIQELELAGKLKLGGDPSTDRKRIDRKWKRQRLVRALL